MNKDRIAYFLVRILIFPLSFCSMHFLHKLGNIFGYILYHTMRTYRKRALSNLALVNPSWNSKKIAIESFQNLIITALEYAYFSRKKDLTRDIICENPDEAKDIIDKGTGIIFFCGHQANWEVLFLEGSQRMPGVAIGRPIKNKYLYDWVTRMREKFGGQMITPRNALRGGLRALREGKFLGIVGDQGMPESSYSSLFLGKKAYTSTAPAILAYKANVPIIVATTRREKGRYIIHYSPPIWPNPENSLENETDRLMKYSLSHLEESILQRPGQWLWQHNRWKGQTPHTIYYRFRKDPILIILPTDPEKLHPLLPHLKTFREIFPKMSLTILSPPSTENLPEAEIIHYNDPHETFLRDYRFKLVFNLAELPHIASHYEKLSVFETLSQQDLRSIAKEHLFPDKEYTFSDILKRATCRPNTIWSRDA